MAMLDLADEINRFAAEQPTGRVLQELRDALSTEAWEMLGSLVNETLP